MSRPRFVLIGFALLMLFSRNAAAYYPGISYLGIEQGLSNNAVTSIFQDHRGFIWVGTYDGLNRYDGYHFTVFRNRISDSNSLVNNRIACIEEDEQNNLWIGTRGGACVYDNMRFRFRSIYYLSLSHSTIIRKISGAVSSIKTGPQGDIFLASGVEGLLICENGSTMAVQVPLITGKEVYNAYNAFSIEPDAAGRLWVFVKDIGLCRFDEKSRTLLLVNDSIKNGNVLRTDGENLWLGTDEGLFIYSPSKNSFDARLLNNKIVNLYFDSRHVFWIASDGGGMFTMQDAGAPVVHFTSPDKKELLSSVAVYAICEDKEGRKWVGTLRGGINVIDPNKIRFRTIAHDPLNANSLVNNYILSFCEDTAQNLWIGTDGGGLSYWNRKQNTYSNFRHEPGNDHSLSANFVSGILDDYQNNIWTITWGAGINRYEPSSRTFKHFSCFNTVKKTVDRFGWRLYEDKQKTLWAGTCNDGGLYYFNRASEQFELFDDRLINILTLSEDGQGDLWGGNFTSLIKIDRSGKKHRWHCLGYSVRAIHEDRWGNFWIGTEGGGLLLFDRQKESYVRFTDADGLPNNSVLSILEDKEGNLWMSTYNGISKFNIRKRSFKNYSQSDGLQSNQFNYNGALILRSGEFIFGGIMGFNIFFPSEIITRDKDESSKLVLSAINIDNVPVSQDESYISKKTADDIDELRIPFDKAAISFDFVSLEYSAPDKIDYAYYLEGFDKGWNYVGKTRTANYTRLHEGTYVFRMKSTNTEGVWNKQDRAITVIVLPPWYRTWWAYLLYAAAAFGLLYLYLQYKARQTMLKYEVKLANMEKEKEKELTEKKLSFFTNISHEFRTPLTLIINPVKELLKHSVEAAQKTELNIVYRNAKRLLSLVDQLLLFRKADSEGDKLNIIRLNFYDLCLEVYGCFLQQAKAKQIRYEFKCDNAALALYIDREKIEIALFNLISNAMKFTPDGGTVLFEVNEKENTVEVKISDTGCGIDQNAAARIFEKFYRVEEKHTASTSGFGIGLYLVKYFVESHQGKITYESIPGKGTCFYLSLQKGRAHFNGNVHFRDVTEKSVLLEELTPEDTGPAEEPGKIKTAPPRASVMISDKKTLLVVDDNAEIRGYIRQIFAEQMIIYEAENGSAGLKLARTYMPDIIISDIVMPVMNGVELCNKVKEDPALNHIFVILLTATSASEIKLKSIEGGADDYMTKPFEKDLLIAKVNNVLKSRNTLQRYFFDRITLRENHLKVSAEYKHFLERCIGIVEENLDNEDFNVDLLATRIGMSHSNLYKKVKSISGQSVNAFIRSIRLRKAAVLLLSTNTNINEAAFQVGINDIKYFREQFFKLFGVNPSEYIKRYRHVFNQEFHIIKQPAG